MKERRLSLKGSPQLNKPRSEFKKPDYGLQKDEGKKNKEDEEEWEEMADLRTLSFQGGEEDESTEKLTQSGEEKMLKKKNVETLKHLNSFYTQWHTYK